ncbi:hypothetical protein RJ641_034085 [Dillenia turbinata]|uniref:Protein-tyrosine-phosphatase MKP1 C-terminal domain-containing protein n=1 Tax=Dillenia turbinata TaxID=194707 RepID=A0AAN8VMZ9_9MAGN
MHCFNDGDPNSVYLFFAPALSLARNMNVVLYISLGSKVACKKCLTQSINDDGICNNSQAHWRAVGDDFLNQMGLPLCVPIQFSMHPRSLAACQFPDYVTWPTKKKCHFLAVVFLLVLTHVSVRIAFRAYLVLVIREGEEPEQLLNHLSTCYFEQQKTMAAG